VKRRPESKAEATTAKRPTEIMTSASVMALRFGSAKRNDAFGGLFRRGANRIFTPPYYDGRWILG
jgi:hypothetical protein